MIGVKGTPPWKSISRPPPVPLWRNLLFFYKHKGTSTVQQSLCPEIPTSSSYTEIVLPCNIVFVGELDKQIHIWNTRKTPNYPSEYFQWNWHQQNFSTNSILVGNHFENHHPVLYSWLCCLMERLQKKYCSQLKKSWNCFVWRWPLHLYKHIDRPGFRLSNN